MKVIDFFEIFFFVCELRKQKKDGARFDMFQYFASNKAKCVVEESSCVFLQNVDLNLWMMKVDRTAEKMSCSVYFSEIHFSYQYHF